MVAGGFNGASWRRWSGPDQHVDSTLEEAPLVPPVPTPFVGLGELQSSETRGI